MDWPAADMLPLIALIQDPRTVVKEGGVVRLSDEQARAILALTLSRLTGLGRDEIFGEARSLAEAIAGYLAILGSRERIMAIVREELVAVRDAFAVPRRTAIVEGDADVEDEDLIPREEMVVTVTHGGYVKRTPLSAYRTQHRGGKGKSGMNMKEEDAITRVFSASTHAPVLFFSSEGKVYKLKVWKLPNAAANARGRSFNKLLPIEQGERITSILPLPEDEAQWETLDVMFATTTGGVRRNKLSDFVNVNRAGKIAMKLDEGQHIVGVSLCNPGQDVLRTTAGRRSIRFEVGDVRGFLGRDSNGVRGIRLADGDAVISMTILRHVEVSGVERAAYLRYAAAQRAARLCGINLIAQMKLATGDLDRVARIVKLGGFVQAGPDFFDIPAVINGCSDLMVEVFGEAGRHARAAVGVYRLPRNFAVEVDAVVELQS